MTIPSAHDTGLYTIGKGIVKFTVAGGTERDLGNCPELSIEQSSDFLEHFSSREGIKTSDKKVLLSRSITGKMVLDEMDPKNLEMFFAATVTGTGDSLKIEAFKGSPPSGKLVFTGTNSVGPKYVYTFPNCTINAAGAISLIGEDWQTLEFELGISSDPAGNFLEITPFVAPTTP